MTGDEPTKHTNFCSVLSQTSETPERVIFTAFERTTMDIAYPDPEIAQARP
jgi:hypothetical protein